MRRITLGSMSLLSLVARRRRLCRSSSDRHPGGGEYDLRHLSDRGQKGA